VSRSECMTQRPGRWPASRLGLSAERREDAHGEDPPLQSESLQRTASSARAFARDTAAIERGQDCRDRLAPGGIPPISKRRFCVTAASPTTASACARRPARSADGAGCKRPDPASPPGARRTTTPTLAQLLQQTACWPRLPSASRPPASAPSPKRRPARRLWSGHKALVVLRSVRKSTLPDQDPTAPIA